MSKVIIFTEALTYSMIKIFFISYKWECPSVLQLWCFYWFYSHQVISVDYWIRM